MLKLGKRRYSAKLVQKLDKQKIPYYFVSGDKDGGMPADPPIKRTLDEGEGIHTYPLKTVYHSFFLNDGELPITITENGTFEVRNLHPQLDLYIVYGFISRNVFYAGVEGILRSYVNKLELEYLITKSVTLTKACVVNYIYHKALASTVLKTNPI